MSESKYQKKGKSPHKYSAAYNDWKQAAMKGDEAEMEAARERMDRAHPLPQHERN